jgi:hypothetical protein
VSAPEWAEGEAQLGDGSLFYWRLVTIAERLDVELHRADKGDRIGQCAILVVDDVNALELSPHEAAQLSGALRDFSGRATGRQVGNG